MSRIQAEIDALGLRCRKLENDISHLRTVIARMRSYESDEFARETDLIRKLRIRLESVEKRVEDLECDIEDR